MTYWPTRPTKAPVRHLTPEGVTYTIGRYQVTVTQGLPPEDAVTYQADSVHSTEPRQTLPNMMIEDGVLRIPVSDFMEMILAQATPLDIAKGLFENEEVREHVIYALSERWTSDGFGDTDRRRFLAQVQAAVHSKAVDDFADKMREHEWYRAKRFVQDRTIDNVNAWLRNRNIDLHIPYEPEDPMFQIGGKVWNEARDDWRALVLANFPAPAIPEPGAEPDPGEMDGDHASALASVYGPEE